MQFSVTLEAGYYIWAMRRGIPAALQREIRASLDRHIGRRLLRLIRPKTRVRTGRLKRSLYKRRGAGEGLVLEIGYRAPYASFVEYGPAARDRNIERAITGNIAMIRQEMVAAVNRAAAKIQRRGG